MKTIFNNRKQNIALGLIAVAIALSPAAYAGKTSDGPDAQIQADLKKALDKKQFQNVTATVDGGVVKLTGTVAVYADKEEADRLAHHRRNVSAVDDEIQVVGAEVDDATLRSKLASKLEYDRVGYGTTAFNAVTIAVKDGVVTLGGTTYGPADKDSALSVVEHFPGVKDVVDNITVAPLSPNDDHIRMAEFRSIYGFPTLNKYAIDPAKPIRILVVNGKVTLTGVVDSESDKEVASLRANAVPGVFAVTNLLQVANPVVGQK